MHGQRMPSTNRIGLPSKSKAGRETGARTSIGIFYTFSIVFQSFPKHLNLLADRLPYLVRLQAVIR